MKIFFNSLDVVMGSTEVLSDFERIEPIKFQHPGNIVLYGKTYSGKTTFLLNLLSNANSQFKTPNDEPIKRIVYCYGSVWQDKFDILQQKGIIFNKGLPNNLDELFPHQYTPGIIIFDDLQRELELSVLIQDLVSRDAHHRNLTCIVVYQGIHPIGKYVVAIRNQFHTMIYFKFTNEDNSLRKRFRNYVSPQKALDTLMKCYYKWTNRIGGYMIIDTHTRQPSSEYSIRTNILPNEGITRALRKKDRIIKPVKRLR